MKTGNLLLTAGNVDEWDDKGSRTYG